MRPQYDLLAIDLDGTLLNPSGRVSQANRRAVRAAADAGIAVVICTGRSASETLPLVGDLGLTAPMVVSGGAMLADPATGRTLDRRTLDRGLTHEAIAFLADHGHAALILKDHHAAGYDYLVVDQRGPSGLDESTRWWFSFIGVSVRFATDPSLDEHPADTLRVGMYRANEPVEALARLARHTFAPRAAVQHFRSAALPDECRRLGMHTVHIVELFHAHADKWLAVLRLCARLGLDPARTAAIGDQANDLSMITHAGLGIAMDNAEPAVAAAAQRRTRSNAADGVAHAIDQILSGAW
ncbi:MAG: hypothetical protein C0513_02275 [Isosphaera sp.]|nr:hypothetical protein [Isosphaera sp.]